MRSIRFPFFVASAACVVSIWTATSSCLIADSPAHLPETPESPPTIDRLDVLPSNAQVLTVFPSEFVIPVHREDPDSTYEWEMYIDYDPSTGGGLVVPTSAPTTASVVDVSPSAPTLGGCHVIEFIVFAANLGMFNQEKHTPSSVGGDSIIWFYSPSGDLAGCPIYVDAGFDGAFPDASDGGDGGEAGTE